VRLTGLFATALIAVTLVGAPSPPRSSTPRLTTLPVPISVAVQAL